MSELVFKWPAQNAIKQLNSDTLSGQKLFDIPGMFMDLNLENVWQENDQLGPGSDTIRQFPAFGLESPTVQRYSSTATTNCYHSAKLNHYLCDGSALVRCVAHAMCCDWQLATIAAPCMFPPRRSQISKDASTYSQVHDT